MESEAKSSPSPPGGRLSSSKITEKFWTDFRELWLREAVCVQIQESCFFFPGNKSWILVFKNPAHVGDWCLWVWVTWCSSMVFKSLVGGMSSTEWSAVRICSVNPLQRRFWRWQLNFSQSEKTGEVISYIDSSVEHVLTYDVGQHSHHHRPLRSKKTQKACGHQHPSWNIYTEKETYLV